MESGSPSNKIKVLVIDDSIIFRRVLATAIETDDRLELIGTAADAFKAAEIIERVIPDVITLDIEMPMMDGLTFLQKLMKQHPIPVIIVSSITKGNRAICMDAYHKGAIDIIDKPIKLKSDDNLHEFYDFVCEKVRGAAHANVRQKQKLVFDLENMRHEILKPVETTFDEIIAIGASAGGTTAIEFILRRLPKNMPGIVITQHMPQGFTKLFADRLNDVCDLEVIEAKDNDMVVPGRVLIAPGNRHMLVNGNSRICKVNIVETDPVNRHRPSVDVMFNSVAASIKDKATGILLTGMGADGARGLLTMKNAGAHTIVQDKDSSVVYGMPYQGFLLNAHEKEMSLTDIPEYLIRRYQK
ncbi:MAG TPA: chemotaxis response regulator protein-glutamate methylesterase [Prolixibacteraceae bacterium]|nr:chemotaxis response regulator protein-glutamate methylesterase [Prolixibacteraceae bacterium]HPS13151.1 chemotaxis response regulator protein-glutamate methylesterase [Prolixibacteraceae bacterium]